MKAGDRVYSGMIVGEHSHEGDLEFNICKEKKLTNIRAAGKDEAIILTPPRALTPETPYEWIAQDDRVVTIGRYKATVNETGKTMDGPIVHVFTIRDGKVVRFLDFGDTAMMADAYPAVSQYPPTAGTDAYPAARQKLTTPPPAL